MIFKLALMGTALVLMVGQYIQEAQRLAAIKRLPAAEARAFYERSRGRSEVALVVVTMALLAMALGIVGYTFVWQGR
jgi:hypothetical protein